MVSILSLVFSIDWRGEIFFFFSFTCSHAEASLFVLFVWCKLLPLCSLFLGGPLGSYLGWYCYSISSHLMTTCCLGSPSCKSFPFGLSGDSRSSLRSNVMLQSSSRGRALCSSMWTKNIYRALTLLLLILGCRCSFNSSKHSSLVAHCSCSFAKILWFFFLKIFMKFEFD